MLPFCVSPLHRIGPLAISRLLRRARPAEVARQRLNHGPYGLDDCSKLVDSSIRGRSITHQVSRTIEASVIGSRVAALQRSLAISYGLSHSKMLHQHVRQPFGRWSNRPLPQLERAGGDSSTLQLNLGLRHTVAVGRKLLDSASVQTAATMDSAGTPGALRCSQSQNNLLVDKATGMCGECTNAAACAAVGRCSTSKLAAAIGMGAKRLSPSHSSCVAAVHQGDSATHKVTLPVAAVAATVLHAACIELNPPQR